MARVTVRKTAYHAKTLYLFAADDIGSIILPKTLVGVLLPLTDTLFQDSIRSSLALQRTPLVILWVWTNLLLFNLSNQSQSGAIIEDSKNKPWRPLPAQRLTASNVRHVILVIRVMTVGIGLLLGGAWPSLILQLLTYGYNDLGGGDSWAFRNLINAGGYICFDIGAMNVARGFGILSTEKLVWQWLFMIGIVISSTMHMQDLYDQDGDRVRGRNTFPLAFGDIWARYSIAIPVLIWSFLVPALWGKMKATFMVPLTLGAVIAVRLFTNPKRSVQYDKLTFKLWSTWVVLLYTLPLWTIWLAEVNRALG